MELLQDVKRKDGVEEYYRQMGRLARSDYWFYLRAVVGYQFLDPWDHGEEQVWFLEQNLGSPMMFVMPRGSCKSAVITIPFIPWALARDPMLRGLITNVRDPRARAFARQAAEVVTSPRYQACFPYVTPGRKWGEEGYYTTAAENEDDDETESEELRAVESRVEASIGSVGVGGNITSNHVGVLIHDDLVSEATYDSESEHNAATKFLNESFNCIDIAGQMIMCFTRWKPDDVYEPYVSGVKQGPGGRFKVFVRGARKTRFVLNDSGEVENEIFNPKRPWKDAHGKTKWVGYDDALLDSLETAHGDLYFALYENRPISDANRRLRYDLAKGFKDVPFELSSEVRVGIEAGGPQDVMYTTLLRHMREENRAFPVQRMIPPRNKDKQAHIQAALGHLLREERFFASEEFWRRSGIEKEMKDFPLGSSDDLLDSVKWGALKAPQQIGENPPVPFISIDSAFTVGTQSNYTAVTVCCWHGNHYHVLEGRKFKTQDADVVIQEIFRMYDKYSKGGTKRQSIVKKKRGFYSPGNERPVRRQAKKADIDLWGKGAYTAHYLQQEAENERRASEIQTEGNEQDSGVSGFGEEG